MDGCGEASQEIVFGEQDLRFQIPDPRSTLSGLQYGRLNGIDAGFCEEKSGIWDLKSEIGLAFRRI